MILTKIKNAFQSFNVRIFFSAICPPLPLHFHFFTEKHDIGENLAKMLSMKDFKKGKKIRILYFAPNIFSHDWISFFCTLKDIPILWKISDFFSF